MLNVLSISKKECADLKYNLDVNAHEGHMCTINKVNQGTCAGDSGGPLVWRDGQLVGIVNYAVPCARGLPEGYAKLSYYYRWIQQKTQWHSIPEMYKAKVLNSP